MISDEVFQLAKRFLREGTPSRNRALERFREPSFSRAARLAGHVRELVKDLEARAPDEVDAQLVDGRLRFRFQREDGARTMFLDAHSWALARDQPALAPWRALGDQLRAAA